MRTLISVDEVADLLNREFLEIEEKYITRNLNKEEIFEKVKSVVDAICIILNELEESYKHTPETIKSLRVNFQQKTNNIIMNSYITNRTRTWPQGHQGDYKTLEAIYRNAPLSEGLGYYMDLYALNHPLARAIRNRVAILENVLRDEIKMRQKPHILNIACGSCRELMSIASELAEAKAKVICIDDDSDALNFSLNRLMYTRVSKNISFRKYNALRMFDQETNLKEFNTQDIIYSIGLFDYLPDDFLVNLFKALFRLLNENGKLIIAFKDANHYDSILFRWICDWDGFRQRREPDFIRILNDAQIPFNNVKSFRDETNIVTFYIVDKIRLHL